MFFFFTLACRYFLDIAVPPSYPQSQRYYVLKSDIFSNPIVIGTNCRTAFKLRYLSDLKSIFPT